MVFAGTLMMATVILVLQRVGMRTVTTLVLLEVIVTYADKVDIVDVIVEFGGRLCRFRLCFYVCITMISPL